MYPKTDTSLINFNPHTREGCDLHRGKFQCVFGYFNPHTREGCDATPRNRIFKDFGISIHTPVKGVTGVRQNNDKMGIRISIHTPVKGVTVLPAFYGV